jgi:hypothetical protein
MAAPAGAPPSRGGRASTVIVVPRSPPGAAEPRCHLAAGPRAADAGAQHQRRPRTDRSPPPEPPRLSLAGSLAAAGRGGRRRDGGRGGLRRRRAHGEGEGEPQVASFFAKQERLEVLPTRFDTCSKINYLSSWATDAVTLKSLVWFHVNGTIGFSSIIACSRFYCLNTRFPSMDTRVRRPCEAYIRTYMQTSQNTCSICT